MIQKLRRKFVLINMLLVMAVLLIVFIVLCTTTYQRSANQSHETLVRALQVPDGGFFQKPQIGQKHENDRPIVMEPVFVAVLDEQGNILSSEQENVSVSDEVLNQAVQKALQATSDEGVLRSLNLRYLRQQNAQGYKIAFLDRSQEMRSMQSLVITSALVGLGGLVAFFFVSLFLSYWALRPVERSWSQQRQFVADASHELKTPLTVILANTGIVLSHKEQSVSSQEKWLVGTREEGLRMKKLIDDLLYLAKSDAQKQPLVKSRVNLSDVVWSCLLPFESVAYENKVQINADIAPEKYTMGDESKLRELTVILLDNACKYAGENGVVTVELAVKNEKIQLSVHNTGETISPKDLQHIFERFYRCDQARVHAAGGYGLGLSIAQSIVQSHQGKIWAKSDAANGTTFTVQLPCAK